MDSFAQFKGKHVRVVTMTYVYTGVLLGVTSTALTLERDGDKLVIELARACVVYIIEENLMAGYKTVYIVVWFENKRGICLGGVFESEADANARRQEVYEELHELDVRYEGLRVGALNIQPPLEDR